jgi:hypothetical protein
MVARAVWVVTAVPVLVAQQVPLVELEASEGLVESEVKLMQEVLQAMIASLPVVVNT